MVCGGRFVRVWHRWRGLLGTIARIMIRIRHITDPDLKRRVLEALAARRGCSVAAIPEWFELDDHDYVDLLNDIKEAEEGDRNEHDPRE